MQPRPFASVGRRAAEGIDREHALGATPAPHCGEPVPARGLRLRLDGTWRTAHRRDRNPRQWPASTGAAYCWGANGGALGDGSYMNSSIPVAVSGGLSFSALAAGGGFTCGLTSAGTAYCWGNNTSGQLGNYPPNDNVGIPTPVL